MAGKLESIGAKIDDIATKCAADHEECTVKCKDDRINNAFRREVVCGPSGGSISDNASGFCDCKPFFLCFIKRVLVSIP